MTLPVTGSMSIPIPQSSSSASSSKSTSGSPSQDVLKRLLSNLSAKKFSELKGGALTLREHVEEEVRDLSGEDFNRFMDNLYERLQAMIESSSPLENFGAVLAIDELVDVSLGENAAKISRFASFLRLIFEEKTDPETIISASKTLGHLARSGGPLTAEVVEFQVRQAMDWLQGERMEARRFAAVLILKEMAINAPTVFNIHVPLFIDTIWTALRDSKPVIRERAVEALRACLCVIEKRETRWRVQGYYRLFEETQKGLSKNVSVESIHGSLLAIGELLRNTGEFMMARYKEVADIVLKYRDHRDRLVRRSITALLPRIAHFLRDRFLAHYFKISMDYLIGVMKNQSDKDCGFTALGEMAGAVGVALIPYLPTITVLLKESILPKRGKCCNEALACVGELTSALGSLITEHVRGLLNVCFSAGLSTTLVETLVKVSSRLPSLLPVIQEKLMDAISLVLARKTFRVWREKYALKQESMGKGVTFTVSHNVSSDNLSHNLIQLALKTLSSFNFQGYQLIEFARDNVIQFLDDDDALTRKEAAICCCKLLENSISPFPTSPPPSNTSSSPSTAISPFPFLSPPPTPSAPPSMILPLASFHAPCSARTKKQQLYIEEMMHSLIISSVTDPDSTIRKVIFQSLSNFSTLDNFLCQADALRAIFIALNDESFSVREHSIILTGRLSLHNPAYVYPSLRRHLSQLLIDLEHSSDSKQREESARLIGSLIRHCPKLILPYISPILKALMERLTEAAPQTLSTGLFVGGSGSSGVVLSVLVTVGKLARVGGTALKPYLPRLMPMVIDSLSDVSLSERREVVVATLGELVQSTGYVITPYTEYPQLLGILLRLLNGELAWSICRVVIQVLGILGALDPHVHKRNLNIMQQGPADVALRPESSATNLTAGVVGGGQAAGHLANVHARSSDAYSLELLPPSGLSTSSEDYYNTVAIATLMRVLRDGTLSTYHYRVVRSLMYIFKAIGLACVPYLPRVMPDLFSVMHSSDENLREHLFWQLAQLVSIVRQHIRKYLSDIMSLVYEYWSTLLLSSSIPPPSSPILHLVEELSKALHSEYKPYLLEILPRCVSVLAEAERKGEYSKVSSILHAFEVLGDNMEEQMHLLLPALLRLFKNDVSEAPIEVRASAMRTLSRLVSSMQFSAHASAIVHPLMQVLGTAIDELKREAMNVICALALSLGNDFSIFIPPIKKILQKIKYHHAKFELIVRKIQSGELSMFIESVFSSGHGSSSNNDSALFADDMINNNQSNVNVNAHSNHRSESSHGKDHNAGMGNTKPSDLLSLNPSNNNLMMMNAHDPWTDGNISTNHASTSHFDIDGDKSIDAEMDGLGNRVLKINESHLKKAWESSQRSTKEDWTEWMRHFSVELLKESPSPALRTCAGLAKRQPRVARELFAAVFVSCWNELNESSQEQLVRSLEAAFASPNIPPEILATLLNLAEFMDHDEKPLPVDIRTLAALAEKCHAFAKALHYKEMEFESNPTATVEDLIHVNNQLHQHEAAVGILVYAQRHLAVELKESWYEKLQRWEEALTAYERKCMQGENAMMVFDAMLGKMRCLSALARWQELSTLCRNAWTTAESSAKMEMAPLGATAAWNMGKWDDMAEYVAVLDDGDEAHAGSRMPSHTLTTHGGMGSGTGPSDGAFFRAVLCVRRGRFAEAQSYVERARKLLGTELAALVLESYERAYNDVVRVQQLSELEEVIEYCMLPPGEPVSKARAEIIQCMWQDRIFGVQRNVEVWQALLAVRSLVLPPDRDLRTWMKFASLCRKNGRVGQANSTLLTLLQGESATSATSMQLQQQSGGQIGLLSPAASKPGALGWGVPGAANAHPQVKLAYLKHVWALGGEGSKRHAFLLLQELSTEISRSPFTMDATVDRGSERGSIPLLAKVYQKLGSWQWALHPFLSDSTIEEVEVSLKSATEIAPEWGKAWHVWALFNTASMSYHIMKSQPAESQRHIVAAVTAYFRSISLASKSTKPRGYDSLQDILRLLTLWFSHGATADVQTALQEGFAHVSIDTWLLVIPQIIARIHSNSSAVRGLIQNLLIRIGRHHPQALMFPLLVACKSLSAARRTAAQAVLDNIRAFNPGLVDAAKLVSLELIRVAILWHEMWHEGLEEASRLYFGERNVEAMLAVLSPLHAMLDQHGPETLNEVSFVQSYGGELREANECCESFKKTGKESELTRAWDLYYHVFKRINKQLPSLTSLELQLVSPALLDAKNLDLAVPGTYRAGSPSITIAGFSPQIHVITSKQRPRKISVRGSDGMDYYFLLKGHEDLRLDERVMQLFGLVNSLLANARSAAEKDLSIERYAVIPLSPNSGLIEWLVPCDTLHQLIREYRDARKMPVNIEHRLMLAFAPDYDNLTLIAKVEVFRHALENTPGNDLARILWLKSRSSEVWLNRRTNYTRSLAVMSMVGYILGLGDRHPSNLMLDRISGKIVHIDFGDCFEASMNREKFPEKVPFRLTRMLVKAMEVSGMEGNFLFTCESVMHVLRSNKDSVMAMMEAFVHDPLINWRLFNITGTGAGRTGGEKGEKGEREDSGNNGMSSFRPSPPLRSTRERELLQAVGMLGDANDVLNDRAVAVMTRMSNKLTGRDFHPLAAGVGGGVVAGAGAGERGAGGSGSMMVRNSSDPGYGSVMGQSYEVRDEPGLSVSTQVQKLVAQATSHENLCQSYIGWCPFW